MSQARWFPMVAEESDGDMWQHFRGGRFGFEVDAEMQMENMWRRQRVEEEERGGGGGGYPPPLRIETSLELNDAMYNTATKAVRQVMEVNDDDEEEEDARGDLRPTPSTRTNSSNASTSSALEFLYRLDMNNNHFTDNSAYSYNNYVTNDNTHAKDDDDDCDTTVSRFLRSLPVISEAELAIAQQQLRLSVRRFLAKRQLLHILAQCMQCDFCGFIDRPECDCVDCLERRAFAAAMRLQVVARNNNG